MADSDYPHPNAETCLSQTPNARVRFKDEVTCLNDD
jgi:hypothetical protein